jgi:predicted membrane protein (TIGR00267 family)
MGETNKGKPMKPSETNEILASLQDERDGARLYLALAEAEKDPHIAEVYRRIAAVEQRHAEAWTARLQSSGVAVPAYSPSWRTRLLSWLARRFGPGIVLPTIVGFEKTDTHGYSRRSDAQGMAADESSHARLLSNITGGMEGGRLAQLEGRHRAAGGNALRAAVLGANDGLVSNLSLVMGVAGAELSNTAILITGFAGLLAGAISMALGEWLSVQSSRELYEHQIGIERAEIASAPQEEAEELALIYQSRGVEEEQARSMAQQIMQDQTSALDTLAREELSVNPEELGGSAWEAAITSFVLFALGAIIPVFPYIFLEGMTAVFVSVACSMVGLFIIGAGITLFTGKSVLFSGVRQMAFGLAAAAVTYVIGRLIGVNLAG